MVKIGGQIGVGVVWLAAGFAIGHVSIHLFVKRVQKAAAVQSA